MAKKIAKPLTFEFTRLKPRSSSLNAAVLYWVQFGLSKEDAMALTAEVGRIVQRYMNPKKTNQLRKQIEEQIG